jgi:hypothetical protein
MAMEVSYSQEASKLFQLILPDFSEKAFDQSAATIEIASRPIRNLQIQVLESSAKNIGYGRISVRINGKGFGNAFDRKANLNGIVMVMNPQTLGLRPDQVFDPFENAIEVVAEDRKGRKYYHNWVVRVNEAAPTSLFTYTSAVSPDDATGFPPDLRIAEPTAPVALGQRATFKGTFGAAAPGTILKINGATVATAAKPSGTFEHALAIAPTMKEVTVEAVDPKGNRRGAVIPIVRPAAGPKPRFAGNRYAVVIGISDFGKSKEAPPRLPSAAADAGEIARVLEANGFAKDNIRLIRDEQATADQIRVAFSDFAAKAGPNDFLAVYVSTYGLHDPFTPDHLYLAANGTQLKQVDVASVSIEELATRLMKSVRCNNTLLVFDVGHKLPEGDVRFPSKNLINSHLVRLFAEDDGRAVLVSGSADEVGRTKESSGGAVRSIFSEAVASAFEGNAADLNRDRVLTAEEMIRFVTEKVKQQTGGAQNPRFSLGKSPVAAPLAILQ